MYSEMVEQYIHRKLPKAVDPSEEKTRELATQLGGKIEELGMFEGSQRRVLLFEDGKLRWYLPLYIGWVPTVELSTLTFHPFLTGRDEPDPSLSLSRADELEQALFDLLGLTPQVYQLPEYVVQPPIGGWVFTTGEEGDVESLFVFESELEALYADFDAQRAALANRIAEAKKKSRSG
jgi:hypothetical protein